MNTKKDRVKIGKWQGGGRKPKHPLGGIKTDWEGGQHEEIKAKGTINIHDSQRN